MDGIQQDWGSGKNITAFGRSKTNYMFFFLATSKTILNLDLDTLHDLNV